MISLYAPTTSIGFSSVADYVAEQTVCVRPQYVKQCVADLRGSDVRVDSVIGFHEGTHDLSVKLQYEASC